MYVGGVRHWKSESHNKHTVRPTHKQIAAIFAEKFRRNLYRRAICKVQMKHYLKKEAIKAKMSVKNHQCQKHTVINAVLGRKMVVNMPVLVRYRNKFLLKEQNAA